MLVKIFKKAFVNAINKIKNDKEFYIPLSIQYLFKKKRPR